MWHELPGLGRVAKVTTSSATIKERKQTRSHLPFLPFLPFLPAIAPAHNA